MKTTLMATACICTALSGASVIPEKDGLKDRYLNVKMSTSEVLSSFQIAQPKGYVVKVGDDVTLLKTLLVAENPDYDPLADTKRVTMSWNLPVPVSGVVLSNANNRQAKLTVHKRPNPPIFAAELVLSVDGKQRTMFVPFEVR